MKRSRVTAGKRVCVCRFFYFIFYVFNFLYLCYNKLVKINFKLMYIRSMVNRENLAKVPFWLALIFIIVFFVLGVFLGRSNYFQAGQSIIKGIKPDSEQSAGTVKNTDQKIPDYLTKDVDFNLFWETWNMIKAEYYDENIPDTKLFYGALSGMVAALEDPHTMFMTPENTDEFNQELDGKFEGIGAEIGIRSEILSVIVPLADSPALKAGLQPKDLILKIDGQDTKGMGLTKAVSLIRGAKGTKVILNIYRDGFKEPRDFEITRDAIRVKNLELEFKEGNIAYVKLRQFNGDTVPLFNDAIIEILKKPNLKGIIFDMRYNPGGYLQSAIDVAGEWVDGEVVVKEKLRGGEEVLHKSDKKDRLGGIKTVVLVNAGSASGSEIVAGALQDLGKATIVGEKTYGKGSVQKLNSLPDGSSVKLTVAKWFTPKGNSIDGNGITPDVAVEMMEEDYNSYKDPQLDRAIEIITSN